MVILDEMPRQGKLEYCPVHGGIGAHLDESISHGCFIRIDCESDHRGPGSQRLGSANFGPNVGISGRWLPHGDDGESWGDPASLKERDSGAQRFPDFGGDRSARKYDRRH